MKSGVRQFMPEDVISTPELKTADPQYQSVSWMDSAKAMFEADSTVLDYLSTDGFEYERQEGYNPIDDVPADLIYQIDEFLGSGSQGESEQIAGRLRYEGDRNVKGAEHMTAALLGSFGGTLLGSPEYLPLMLWAPSALGRTAAAVGRTVKTAGAMRHAVNAAKVGGVVAAEETIHEALLQQSTLSRTLGESAVNVATAGLFGATIGGVSSALMRGRYIDQVTDEANDAVNGVAAKRMEDYIQSNERLIFNTDNTVQLVSDRLGGTTKTKFDTAAQAEFFLKNRAGVETSMDKSAGAMMAGLGEDAMPKRAKWRDNEFMRKRGVSALRSPNVQLERGMLFARSPLFHDEVMNRTWGHTRPTVGTEKGLAKAPPLSRQAERQVGKRVHQTKKVMYDNFFGWMGNDNVRMMRNNTKMARMGAAVLPKFRKKYKAFNDRVDWAIRNDNKDQLGDPFVEAAAREVSQMTTEVKNRAVKEAIYGTEKVPIKDEEGNLVVENGKVLYRDQPIDPADNVKYANTWGSKSWNPVTLRRDRKEVQDILTENFKKERAELAEEVQKAETADKVLKKKERIAKRNKENAAKIKREEGKIETLRNNLYKNNPNNSGKVTETRQNNIVKARKQLDSLKKKLADDKTIARLETEIADLEKHYKYIGTEEWLDEQINKYDLYETVNADVLKSFSSMVNGEAGGRVYGNADYKPSSAKERKIPIHDNEAMLPERQWLERDVLSWTRNYYESTLRPTMMKELHGDTEMEAVMDRVTDQYNEMAQKALDAGDVKLANSFSKEAGDIRKQNRVALNRYYHRSLVPKDPESIGANLSRLLRDFNVSIRMGGVAPTSLSDAGRYNMAKIYAPEIGQFGTTVRDAWKSMKVNRETMQDGGIAHEVSMNVRAAKMLGNDDPNPADWAITRAADKIAYGLMRSTGLGELTDFGKLTVSNLYQNELFRMAKNWNKLTPKTKAKLAEAGFDEGMANGMMKEFNAGKIKYLDDHNRAVATNYGTWGDQDLAERFKDVLFNKSEQKLATPTELTAPIWADNEFAKLVLQFKSFSLAAHSQVTVPLANRIAKRDALAAQTIATALAMGVITEVIKAFLAGEDAFARLDDYTPSDWVYASIDRGALMPLLMIGFNGLDTLSQNNLSKMIDRTSYGYPSRHDWTQGLGPSAGLISDIFDVASSGAGGSFNQRDLHTLRKLIPFNNLAWISRPLVTPIEEGAANVLNLPSGKRKAKSRVRK